MRTHHALTADDAALMIAAGKAEAMINGWNIAIVVVDAGGYPIHMERMDGAPLQAPAIAQGKAFAAAISRTPTKTLEEVVKERPAVVMMPDRLAIQGGVPIIYEGECVGGIGVSGVKSHEDEVVALAARAALIGA
jgi:glc operon protein GlcG